MSPAHPLSVTDNDACNGIETCDPANGCQNGTPLTCDDGDVCNGDETCDPANGCGGGTPLSCDDGNACTLDSCNPLDGCESSPAGDCDDGDLCTVDSCDPVTGCENTPVVCDDGNSCTEDFCNPNTGECVSEGVHTDHFLGYQVRRSRHAPKLKIKRDVHLKDQFGEKKVRVKKLVELYNPADKNNEGICQQETHLKAYTIRTYRHHDREHDDHHDHTPLRAAAGTTRATTMTMMTAGS